MTLTFSFDITIHKLIAQFAQYCILFHQIQLVDFTLDYHLQVFVFHYSHSFNNPVSFQKKNIVGVKAGINFNFIWVTDWETFKDNEGRDHFNVDSGVSNNVIQS